MLQPQPFPPKNWTSVPPGNDFAQQSKLLVQLSTPDLLQRLLPSDHPAPQLSLVCQFVHNRCGTIVASQLLCPCSRWSPPEVTGDVVCQQVWMSTPVMQLRSRFEKVDTETLKGCCNLYPTPNPSPKSRTDRYNVMYHLNDSELVRCTY